MTVNQVDIKTLERLADQMKKDSFALAGLNASAAHSIVLMIEASIGAPLMWPSREAGYDAAMAYILPITIYVTPLTAA